MSNTMGIMLLFGADAVETCVGTLVEDAEFEITGSVSLVHERVSS